MPSSIRIEKKKKKRKEQNTRIFFRNRLRMVITDFVINQIIYLNLESGADVVD